MSITLTADQKDQLKIQQDNHPNYKISIRANGSFRYENLPNGKTLTQQHHAEHCKMSNILNGHRKTGIAHHNVNHLNPKYLDNPMEDFQATQEKITEFNSYFNDLPAPIREKFKNKPHNLLTFIAQSENKEEAQKLGLLPTPPTHSTASAVEPAVSTETASTTQTSTEETASGNEADQ